VLGVRVPPRGTLRSDEAGPDLGYPQAVFGGGDDGECLLD
jgi:hypothetical protein